MYIVATGYAFTSKRGIIAEGDEITEKDFANHEAFVKAVSKKKIIMGKSKEQAEKEAAEKREKEKQDSYSAERQKKEEALITARHKKEAASAAVNTAKEALATAQADFDKTTENHAAAAQKLHEAQGAAINKRTANKALNDAYDTLVRATDELKSAKKPAEKTAADGKVAEAKANFAKLEVTDAEYKTAIATENEAVKNLVEAEGAKTEAEAKALAAKEAVTLAEAELEKASAALAALESSLQGSA
jgi:hypothetical protein